MDPTQRVLMISLIVLVWLMVFVIAISFVARLLS